LPPTETNKATANGDSKTTVGTDPFSSRITEDHQGIFVDKGVGSSPRLFKLKSDVNLTILGGECNLAQDENEVMHFSR
jgi:hypothetical protein